MMNTIIPFRKYSILINYFVISTKYNESLLLINHYVCQFRLNKSNGVFSSILMIFLQNIFFLLLIFCSPVHVNYVNFYRFQYATIVTFKSSSHMVHLKRLQLC
ncbi:unnamed protein product [Schistosoma guineensis]|nr:unnamed protein product [Schistosoma guineensis]